MLRLQLCITSIAVILISEAKAVEIGNPSKTSIGSAARRALAARDYDTTVRNPDWLAEIFLGPTERKMLAGDRTIKDLERDYREAIKDQDPITGMNLIRTRFFDERLQHAVSGVAAQVVILGAGYDSRAYRMKELLKGVKVFEVDYGPTQEYKKKRVREVLNGLTNNVVFVPIDFTKQTLADVLKRAGLARDRETFFIWEGVTYYIPEEAVRGTLSYIAGSAPGSAVELDFRSQSYIDWVKANIDSPERVPTAARRILIAQRQFREWGEPMIFGFPDGKEKEFLASEGLEVTEMLHCASPEARQRYLTRRNGTIAFPISPPNGDWPSSAQTMVEAATRGPRSARRARA